MGTIFVLIFLLLESKKAGVVVTYVEREDVGGRGGQGWYKKVAVSIMTQLPEGIG